MDSEPSAQSAGPPPAPPHRPKRRAGKVVEWVWQGAALAELERKRRDSRELELRRRARLCLEVGQLALDSPQTLESGSPLAQVCDLFRQSVYWALLSRRPPGGSVESPAAIDASAAADPTAVWKSVDPSALAALPGDAAQTKAVTDALSGSFADLSELSEARLLTLIEALRTLAESLLGKVEHDQLELERLWLRRLSRLALVAIAVVGLFGAGLLLRESVARGRDVSRGKPWSASSRYGEGGCPSPLQQCPQSPSYFVHTNEEEEPWLELDLGRVERISEAHVSNRQDCCSERVVPLVLAVSVDHRRWTEVSRSTSKFKRWETSFSPVDARWVKLYIPRRSMLHLSEVRILR